MSRLRCAAGARTRMARIYASLDRYNMQGRITPLPRMEQGARCRLGAVGSG